MIIHTACSGKIRAPESKELQDKFNALVDGVDRSFDRVFKMGAKKDLLVTRVSDDSYNVKDGLQSNWAFSWRDDESPRSYKKFLDLSGSEDKAIQLAAGLSLARECSKTLSRIASDQMQQTISPEDILLVRFPAEP